MGAVRYLHVPARSFRDPVLTIFLFYLGAWLTLKKKEKRASRICMHSIFSYNCSAKKEKTLSQATSKKIKQEKKRKLENHSQKRKKK